MEKQSRSSNTKQAFPTPAYSMYCPLLLPVTTPMLHVRVVALRMLQARLTQFWWDLATTRSIRQAQLRSAWCQHFCSCIGTSCSKTRSHWFRHGALRSWLVSQAILRCGLIGSWRTVAELAFIIITFGYIVTIRWVYWWPEPLFLIHRVMGTIISRFDLMPIFSDANGESAWLSSPRVQIPVHKYQEHWNQLPPFQFFC